MEIDNCHLNCPRTTAGGYEFRRLNTSGKVARLLPFAALGLEQFVYAEFICDSRSTEDDWHPSRRCVDAAREILAILKPDPGTFDDHQRQVLMPLLDEE